MTFSIDYSQLKLSTGTMRSIPSSTVVRLIRYSRVTCLLSHVTNSCISIELISKHRISYYPSTLLLNNPQKVDGADFGVVEKAVWRGENPFAGRAQVSLFFGRHMGRILGWGMRQSVISWFGAEVVMQVYVQSTYRLRIWWGQIY